MRSAIRNCRTQWRSIGSSPAPVASRQRCQADSFGIGFRQLVGPAHRGGSYWWVKVA